MTENIGSQSITKNKADMSNFLVHLTKNGNYTKYEPNSKAPGYYWFKEVDGVQAKDSLIEILKKTVIEARSPFGHFKYQISVGFQQKGKMPLEWLTSVCFSETPITEIKSFYIATQNTSQNVNKYQKYGLAFSQQLVLSKKGHPVFYFDSSNSSIVSAVDLQGSPVNRITAKALLSLYESFGPKLHSRYAGSTDFRWEREWRHVGHFHFKLDEVAFGLCPESEILNFEKLVSGQISFIDPDWDSQKTKHYLLSKGQNLLAELF